MNEKKESPVKSAVINTGAIIEVLEKSPLGNAFFREVLENEEIQSFYISPLVETELLYILCRLYGFEEARKIVSELLQDFIICSETNLRNISARLKCSYSISVADCYSFAIAKILNIPIYMKREKEIEFNFEGLSQEITLKFIDDLL